MRMFLRGHQIASHSWTHQDFNAVSPAIRQSQLLYNEIAIRNVLGFFPTYFRPPYVNCNGDCLSLAGNQGYPVIGFNLDTKDLLNDAPNLIQNSKNLFSAGVSRDAAHNSYLELCHDIHLQTVVSLTPYMIEQARSLGYRLVTVGECLGDSADNWYRH